MAFKLQVAGLIDVAELLSLRTAVNEHLTVQFWKGYWSSESTEKGVVFTMKRSTVFIARDRGKLIATLALSTRKPWPIDKSYFHPCESPLDLTARAVDPAHQRKGVGRRCIADARRIAKEFPGDAIRLDAYDADAGAGEFYRKCGFIEVGRAVYRAAPLIYFELLI